MEDNRHEFNIFDHHVASTSSSLTSAPEYEYPMGGVLIVSCMLVLLACVSVILFIYIIRQRQRFRRRREQQRERRQQRRRGTAEKLARRYDTIEGWIISKRVVQHGSQCRAATCDHNDCDAPSAFGKTLLEGLAEETAVTSNSWDESDCGHECPICMEPFEVGDVVSWSPSVSNRCQHVFHHKCIKEWLLRHMHCPFCREVFLPIDGAERDQRGLDELLDQHNKCDATTFYCKDDGLVLVPDSILNGPTSQQRENVQSIIMTSTVRRRTLAHLRGSPLAVDADALDVKGAAPAGSQPWRRRQSDSPSEDLSLSPIDEDEPSQFRLDPLTPIEVDPFLLEYNL